MAAAGPLTPAAPETAADPAAVLVLTRPLPGRGPAARLPDVALLQLPLLELQPRPLDPQLRAQLDRAARSSIRIFVSAMAARMAAELTGAELRQAGVRWYGVGPATAAAVRECFAVPALAPPVEQAHSEGLLALLGPVAGIHIALFGAPDGRDLLAPALRAAGAQVEVVDVYRRCVRQLDAAECAALLSIADRAVYSATSVAVLRALHELLLRLRLDPAARPLVVASARIGEAARELGFGEIWVAAGADAEALAACLQPPGQAC